jgi:hypothetical protein
VIAISAQGFTLDSEDGTAAVTVTAETAFVPRGSGDFGFSSIQMGMYLKTKVWMGEDHTPTGEDGSFVAVVVEESED